MKRLQRSARMFFVSVIMIALLLLPAISAQAKGKGFKDVVKHIEKHYGGKRTKIPLLGVANFAVKLIRPAGVKGFKLAVFEDQNFSARDEAVSFDTVMREAYDKNWNPLVRVSSKRDGGNKNLVYVYARTAGKDVQFAVVTFQEREAVIVEVKFNPDAAVRFLDNPKILGISLGNSIRGNPATIMNPTQRVPVAANRGNSSTNPSTAIDRIPSDNMANSTSSDSASNPGSKARPALSASANNDTNPPLPGDDKTTRAEANIAEVKPDLRDKDAIRIETRLVNLNVKAMDRGGQPLVNLKPADFTVYEDGVKQEITHFKPVNAPVNLILLLDLSGSTKKKRDAMREAATRFIDALPTQDNVAIVAFTRKYRALTNFTNDKIRLKSVLKEINGISGGTAFYDSMWKALDQLDQLSEARKAIVVLTDGEDESILGSVDTDHSFEQLLERTSEEDVTIYPIYFSPSNHYDKLAVLFGSSGSLIGSDKSRIARKQLDDLAEQTGGEVVNAQREEDLEGAYKRVASELHTLYSLAYSPDKLKHNGEFRKVSVKVNSEGAVAKTRKGYYDR